MGSRIAIMLGGNGGLNPYYNITIGKNSFTPDKLPFPPTFENFLVKSESKYITNEFLYGYPGCFDHLEGFEELKQAGILAEYWQFKWKGAEITNAATSSDRIASITIQADSFEEMVEKHNKAASVIKIINSDGNDMMRHDLLTDIR